MRNRFDQFAKLVTREALAPGGAVETDAEVSPDAKRIDIWFTPDPALAPLGILGRIARAACTVEPFHRAPDGRELMDCICKHHLFRCMLAERASRPQLPTQWILSSGRPSSALSGLCFRRSRQWGAGVYHGPPLTHTNLIVIRELPVHRDTLLVRLMGAGRTLRRAIAEIRALPEDALERILALPVLLRLRLEVPVNPVRRTKEDEEFLMSTQDVVEKYLANVRSEGRREALDEGRREALVESLLAIYRARFRHAPRAVITSIQGMRDLTVLRQWRDIIVTGSAEEIAAALGVSSGPETPRRRRPTKKH